MAARQGHCTDARKDGLASARLGCCGGACAAKVASRWLIHGRPSWGWCQGPSSSRTSWTRIVGLRRLEASMLIWKATQAASRRRSSWTPSVSPPQRACARAVHHPKRSMPPRMSLTRCTQPTCFSCFDTSSLWRSTPDCTSSEHPSFGWACLWCSSAMPTAAR